MIPVGKIIRQVRQFVVYRVLHADDTPHRLALGIALGMFIGMTPTVGLQMMLVLLLASVIKANRIVGLPIVWITNPFTIAPIYFFNYMLGRSAMSDWTAGEGLSYQEMRELLGQIGQTGLTELFGIEFWSKFSHILMSIGIELWIGSAVVGVILGLIAYLVSYRAIIWYRTETPFGRLHVRRLARRHKRKLAHEAKEAEKTHKTDNEPNNNKYQAE